VILSGALDSLQPQHVLRGAAPQSRAAAAGNGAIPFPATMDEIERAAAVAALERTGGNKSRAAALLGIGRRRLYTLLGEEP
jgi:DNA-binding NtrC family response regulator